MFPAIEPVVDSKRLTGREEMQRTITLSGVIWDDVEDDGAPGDLEISEDELAGTPMSNLQNGKSLA